MVSTRASERSHRIPADIEKIRRYLVAATQRACPPALADEAEDLVQRALIKLMQSSAHGEGNRSVSTSYLWRVAYTAVIDEIRRRSRRREESLIEDGTMATVAAQRPDPEREAASRRIGEAIRDCLHLIADSRRRAVTLYLVGHSVPELARMLRWTRKRADNLVYRGMADLRRCLSGKGITP